MIKMIKADLKHWLTGYKPNGKFNLDYGRFVGQALEKLGKGGVVGVINARGPDNDLGLDDRFEKFYKLAEKESSINKLGGDGRVFHDNTYDLWFVKGQEINFSTDEGRLTYLLYNLPLEENASEKNHEALKNPETIAILNLPSCKGSVYREKLKYFDGVIIHASNMTIFPGANRNAENFYNSFINGIKFCDSWDSEIVPNKIGAIVVSGGHRSPKEGLIQKIVSPISIGSSYTELPDFKGHIQEDFFNYLRTSIQNSTPENLHKGSGAREMLLQHIPSMIASKYFKK